MCLDDIIFAKISFDKFWNAGTMYSLYRVFLAKNANVL